jgi:hypothetical protein
MLLQNKPPTQELRDDASRDIYSLVDISKGNYTDCYSIRPRIERVANGWQ